MVWKWALALGLAAILAGGCSHPQPHPADGTTVTVGGGTLPCSLAGRWKARQDGWEFDFEPDGRIYSAIISFGRVRVFPGRTTTKPTISGQQAIFTPGPWLVYYDPNTRELTVKITMDHVRVEMAGNIVEGSSSDTFVGPIDLAERKWQAQWTTFTHYVARTPNNVSRDLSTDPTYGETKSLIFDKIEPGNP